jgi:hypothetical protein
MERLVIDQTWTRRQRLVPRKYCSSHGRAHLNAAFTAAKKEQPFAFLNSRPYRWQINRLYRAEHGLNQIVRAN